MLFKKGESPFGYHHYFYRTTKSWTIGKTFFWKAIEVKQEEVQQMITEIDYIQLRKTLKIAIKQTFVYIQGIIGSETLYIFGIYTNDAANYIYPTANTEEGLTRKAKESLKHNQTNTLEEMRKMIRWSPCDWDYHLSGIEMFKEVEEILLTGWEEDFSDYKCDAVKVGKICVDTLKELISEIDDDSLILNLMMGDQSHEQRIENASKCNIPSKVEELKKELDEELKLANSNLD